MRISVFLVIVQFLFLAWAVGHASELMHQQSDYLIGGNDNGGIPMSAEYFWGLMGLLGAFIVNIATVAWWASNLSTRVRSLEARQKAFEEEHVETRPTLAAFRQAIHDVKNSLQRIENRLNNRQQQYNEGS